jgi:hypothetical protein
MDITTSDTQEALPIAPEKVTVQKAFYTENYVKIDSEELKKIMPMRLADAGIDNGTLTISETEHSTGKTDYVISVSSDQQSSDVTQKLHHAMNVALYESNVGEVAKVDVIGKNSVTPINGWSTSVGDAHAPLQLNEGELSPPMRLQYKDIQQAQQNDVSLPSR